MNKAIVVGSLGIALSFAMLAFGYLSGTTPAIGARDQAPLSASAEMNRETVETIVRNYLLTNPEIMIEVQAALEEKQDAERQFAQTEAIRSSSDLIFNANYDGLVGNPAGTTTIVEFFDYNCGYCRRALSDMQELVAADPELRFVLKEFPILGPDSRKAHVVSMAFRALAPEQYGEFHEALLNFPGRANEDTAMKIALSFGIGEEALRDAMNDTGIEAAFNETYALASELAITGTPSYVVGQEVIFGAQGRELLAEKIESARSCAESASC